MNKRKVNDRINLKKNTKQIQHKNIRNILKSNKINICKVTSNAIEDVFTSVFKTAHVIIIYTTIRHNICLKQSLISIYCFKSSVLSKHLGRKAWGNRIDDHRCTYS